MATMNKTSTNFSCFFFWFWQLTLLFGYEVAPFVLIRKPSTTTIIKRRRKVNGGSSSSSQLHMATWSDSKAVKDYQEFLESGKQEIDLKQDLPSVIIQPASSKSSSSQSSTPPPSTSSSTTSYSYVDPPPATTTTYSYVDPPATTASYSYVDPNPSPTPTQYSYVDPAPPATTTYSYVDPVPNNDYYSYQHQQQQPVTAQQQQQDDDESTLMASALVEAGQGGDIVLTPLEELPDQINGYTEYPIYITLPPWQLQEFLMNLPDSYKSRNDDFVFMSGGPYFGNIEDVLKDRGYCRDSMTQVLITGMHVEQTPYKLKLTDVSVNLGYAENGEEKRAGECSVCGKWAGAVSQRLERNSITCKVEFYREWRRRMWETTILDAVFLLLGAIRDQPTSLSQVAQYYTEEVADLIWEMSTLLRGWKAITLIYGFEERLFGMAEFSPLSNLVGPCTVRNDSFPFVWGNSVLCQSQLFVEYLWYAQLEKGFFQGVDLPAQTKDEETKSIMRQGILRANGKI